MIKSTWKQNMFTWSWSLDHNTHLDQVNSNDFVFDFDFLLFSSYARSCHFVCVCVSSFLGIATD